MQSSLLKDRIQIQQKTATLGATGETVTWKPVQTRYGRIVPLTATMMNEYQQMNSSVTHKIIFGKGVPLSYGDYRFKCLSKTYEPIDPPIVINNNTTIVVCEV